ncbi:MAG: DUF5703 domain-containing protein [Spirochaetales bacterium]|nr:DUF5703 domain-containing protein [Spirochaetales bacterium]
MRELYTDPEWHSFSENSEGSMPLGGCGLGLNVWVEKGELLLYFQMSGTFDEHNGFPKMGRLRIIPEQGFSEKNFTQKLNTQKGNLTVSSGEGEDFQKLTIWVSQFKPEFHMEWESTRFRNLKVRYESWHFEDRLSPAENAASSIFGERHDIFAYWMYPHDLTRYKDEIGFRKVKGQECISWHHRNRNDDLAFDKEMDQQGFSPLKETLYNPQKDLIFGGCLTARGLKASDYIDSGEYLGTGFRAWNLVSVKKLNSSLLSVYCQSEKNPDLEDWQNKLDSRVAGSPGDTDCETYRKEKKETENWWENFWNTSHINIRPQSPNEDENSEARQVSVNYRLFRFMLGINNGGDFPSKFNGGLLTYDSVLVHNIEDRRDISYFRNEKKKQDDRECVISASEHVSLDRPYGPDYRAWGGGSITPQNQRLLYWPLLKSGDFSLMDSQFDWFEKALPAAEARVRNAWGHGGCTFCEQVNNFGIPIGSHYGWERPEGMGPGDQISPPVHYHYSTQLEFSWMILEHYNYSGRNISRWMPFILGSVDFFFEHYEHMASVQGRDAYDEKGKLRITPSTGLESYKNAVNPQDVVCPLRRICSFLVEKDLLDDSRRALYRKRLDQIPEPPPRDWKGIQVIAPAESWDNIINVELPQMYPVFPYEYYGVGKDNLQMARDTWTYSCDEILGQKSYAGWHQDGIFCAHLGLVDEAKAILIKKMADSGRRFTAFWGPGHDWVPDHNWGGTGMIQLQDMLLQCDGRRILLFPCWPAAGEVDCKLHAPGGTLVECRLEGGRITRLETTPASRKEDVEVMAEWF